MGAPIKGPADYWEPGDWNARCSICGAKAKASTLVRNWQGFYRHPRCNEPRQPQDFVRGIKENITVPWSQPMGRLFVNFCTLNGQSAIPGFAIPGCMIPGRSTISYEDVSNEYQQAPGVPIGISIALVTLNGIPFVTLSGNAIVLL
jgi:hypothetical protein